MARRNATEEFVERGIQPGDEFQIGGLPPASSLAPLKRVAIFTEAFLPKVDGVSKTAVLVARHLRNTGREVLIFAPDNHGHTPPTLDTSRVVSVGSLNLPYVPPETLLALPNRQIWTELDAFQPDLIHLFSPALLSAAGMWYGKRKKLPVIANYQTDLPGYARRYGFNLLAAPIRRALRWVHNQSHLTLAPSHTVIRQLHQWHFRNIRLWARGVDLKRFAPTRRSDAMRQRLLDGRPDDSLIVLYVGRLATEKRVDLLREVAKLDGVALTIIGDGAEREALESSFGEQARFMGYLFGDDLASAYASADIFAFTGTHETFGQVVTEAMASGLPVLVPNAGGVVDLVLDGMNGYICQVDAADYGAKVMLLRDNPDLRTTLAARALEYAQQRPWENLMAQLEGYYCDALQRNAAQQGHTNITPKKSPAAPKA